ncbi:hypothetical protein HanXRQr2_Chr09g0413341 [Helianthus annuus]|uniref:Uncharacterized protein n=1 Tax=Helianthus annuus TaxID=4232 RepID=A0A9K3IAL6_HELAN|nr:hypothetical protein HanXRQr2_Chr09g0413341 [Helianthus annuus]
MCFADSYAHQHNEHRSLMITKPRVANASKVRNFKAIARHKNRFTFDNAQLFHLNIICCCCCTFPSWYITL